MVSQIKAKYYTQLINDVNVLIKPIPDCDIAEAMDPRLYSESCIMALMMSLIPKRFLKIDFSPKSLGKIRKVFNSVDSTPMVSAPINIEHHLVPVRDGSSIPMVSYSLNEKKSNLPILYYIHGGGFFAGHHGVVEEAMKLLVEKTGIVVYSVDYRLAPEYPYPTGHQDCFDGLLWVHQHAVTLNGNPEMIFIGGDSAGGNLTQYCTNKALEHDLSYVKGQLLLYPTVNLAQISDKYADFDISKIEVYPIMVL